jgi:hypothetical protein
MSVEVLDAAPRLGAMAIRAVLAGSASSGRAIPYPPSWVDRLTAWLDRSAWSFWIAIAIGATGAVLATNVLWWLEGGEVGTFDVYFVVFGLLPFYAIALIRHLDRVATDALTRFRPLLGIDDAAFTELAYRMTTLPSRPALVIPLVIAAGGALSALYDPAAHRLSGVAIGLAAAHLFWESVINVTVVVLIQKIARYLRDVDRIHRQADDVNLLDPAPIYAFSRLTSQAALGLLVLIAALVSTAGAFLFTSDEATRLAVGFTYAAFAAMAISSFVLPLWGMHRRLVAEKERLQSASSVRLTALLTELDHDVAGVRLARADGLNKLLASVLSERDVLARLPTWPWQAATLRGFVSALLLPVVVYLLARAAERIVL